MRKVLIVTMSWDNPPYQPRKIPGGQQDQGHEIVLHANREGYQQPKAFRSESSQVP